MAQCTGTSEHTFLYPVSAEVNSVVERADNKSRFAFEVNTKWSDESTSTCYRGYQEFFQFQCELLDNFPEEGGTAKGHDRTIPYIPGKQMFRRSTKNLALERQPKLHQYMQELLTLPDKIVKSKIVLKFLNDDWEQKHMNAQPIEVNSTTPDELLRSIEAVDMSNGNGVRFINDRSTSPCEDSIDYLVEPCAKDYEMNNNVKLSDTESHSNEENSEIDSEECLEVTNIDEENEKTNEQEETIEEVCT